MSEKIVDKWARTLSEEAHREAKRKAKSVGISEGMLIFQKCLSEAWSALEAAGMVPPKSQVLTKTTLTGDPEGGSERTIKAVEIAILGENGETLLEMPIRPGPLIAPKSAFGMLLRETALKALPEGAFGRKAEKEAQDAIQALAKAAARLDAFAKAPGLESYRKSRGLAVQEPNETTSHKPR